MKIPKKHRGGKPSKHRHKNTRIKSFREEKDIFTEKRG